MATPTIAQFLSPAPSCKQSSTLELAWQCCCRSQQDYLVLLDAAQYPIGVIKAVQIAACLLQTESLPGSTLLMPHFAADVEPLRVISVETPLPFLWQQLGQRQGHWAVVDERSHYLGLLDSSKLLQFVAANPEAIPSLKPLVTEAKAQKPVLPNDRLLQRFRATADLSNLCQKVLLEVLQQMPLPLQLQADDGRVLGQTETWQVHHSSLEKMPAAAVQSPSLLASLEERAAAIGLSQDAHQLVTDLDPHPLPAIAAAAQPPEGAPAWRVWRVPLEVNLAELAYLADSVPDWQLASNMAMLEQVCAIPDLAPATPLLRFWLLVAQPLETWQHLQDLSDRNADLERTNTLRAELLGCLSHELKTPLTSLLGLSKLLQDPRLGPLSDRQNRYAALIYQNARSLKATVNEILDLTRIESGQMTLTMEPVKLADLCHQALLQAEDYNRARGEGEARSHPLTLNQFHLEIEPGLERLVVDELRLQQVLIHLFSNALKCTPETGNIGLTVQHQGDWILLSVWDTGVGIPAEQQRFIFHRLQRIENPLTQRFTGPGLGLVLVRQLARLQGGEISFVSQATQGSQFTLLLPAVSTLPEAIAQPNSVADKPLVILLEQDPGQVESLAQAVESLDCLWAIARSQPELLEKVQQLRPQAVLLNLAVADSSDLLIKQLRAEAEPPMLIAIAAAETQAAKASQVDHILPVPLDPAALQPLLARFRPVPPTLADVTVLLLKQAETLSHSTNPVDRLLQQYQCRVLEVDDVDQAKLLSQIWRPQVILLDPEIDNPETCLQRLSRQPALSSLPVVTLTNAATQFANQLATLRVFPCLASLESASANAASSPLLEVIQVAIQTCQSH